MILKLYRKAPILIFSSVLLTLSSCHQNETSQKSNLDVTDVNHTPAKRQSIGNCWLYATSTWAESLHLTATNESINLSESYWTYWHFYNELRYAQESISTGGTWEMASSIIEQHGWMEEKEFLPAEADLEMSQVQAKAESFVNSELAEGGRLASRSSRTPELMMQVLDEAFGVKMAEAKLLAKPAADLIVGKNAQSEFYGVDQVINNSQTDHSWSNVSYPVVYGKKARVRAPQKRERLNVLKRVMTALNDGQPVIMSVDVDFNALKNTPYATFDLDTLKESGSMGRQGGHLLVLEDYTVRNVPGVGDLGEGNMSPEMKALALSGDVSSLKAKNSWGTNRPERGLTDGHTSFTIEYLDAVLPWAREEGDTDERNAYWHNALSDFILPPGY
ncbi:MAG: hypothetical protein NT027_06145 [Proteobacteria bacterium]|nr:hypothetical protein [Pseudomonadota bacterium]